MNKWNLAIVSFSAFRNRVYVHVLENIKFVHPFISLFYYCMLYLSVCSLWPKNGKRSNDDNDSVVKVVLMAKCQQPLMR